MTQEPEASELFQEGRIQFQTKPVMDSRLEEQLSSDHLLDEFTSRFLSSLEPVEIFETMQASALMSGEVKMKIYRKSLGGPATTASTRLGSW